MTEILEATTLHGGWVAAASAAFLLSLSKACPFAIGKAFGLFDFTQGRLLPLPSGAEHTLRSGLGIGEELLCGKSGKNCCCESGQGQINHVEQDFCVDSNRRRGEDE